jgi:hypothetical protein
MPIPSLETKYKIYAVSVAAIIVKPPRRQVDTNKVKTLAESITTTKVGLLSPIIVSETDTTDYVLVTGLHRLEAFRHLGRDSIPAFVVPASTTETEARMMEIAENHRCGFLCAAAGRARRPGGKDGGVDVGAACSSARGRRARGGGLAPGLAAGRPKLQGAPGRGIASPGQPTGRSNWYDGGPVP